jgi:hypothetical protein
MRIGGDGGARVAAQIGRSDLEDEIRLLGQPLLADHLRFVRDRVVDGADASRLDAVAEWRRANEYYQALEESETGLADEIKVRDLDPTLVPLAEEIAATPRFRRTFDAFPAHFAMVELDKLTLYQIFVTKQHVDGLQSRLGPSPGPANLLRYCQPPREDETEVKAQRIGANRWMFTCPSTDFRSQDPVVLRSDQIRDHEGSGPISAVVGLAVGFGSNFLTAIRLGTEGRIILHNGYHRACALRAAGVKYAPLVIRTVESIDELQVAAAPRVADDPDFYAKSARPPMLKDFFDPKIARTYRVHRTLSMIEVKFEVREHTIRA